MSCRIGFAGLAIPAAAQLAAGCYAHRPLRPGAELQAGQVVRTYFAAPRHLRAATPAGDSLTLRDVRTVEGRITATRGDTLELQVVSIEPALLGSRDTPVRVVPAAGERVSGRRFSAARSLGVAAALAAGIWGFLILTGPDITLGA